jgi:hypothetical protein
MGPESGRSLGDTSFPEPGANGPGNVGRVTASNTEATRRVRDHDG